MGSDRGVDLSRRAIKAARVDLEEALTLLSPDRGNGGTATPVLASAGVVEQLTTDEHAMAGDWPAAFGFKASSDRAVEAVTSSYKDVVTQLESVVRLFNQALSNYDGVEVDGEGRSQQVQV
jgi:hypothetical protein